MKDVIELQGKVFESPASLFERSGITAQTLRNLTRGKGKPLKIGMRVYYDRDLIEKQLMNG